MQQILILIPAYNEEKVIGQVLKSLPRKVGKGIKVDWMVVDDGSSDDTAQVAKKYGARVFSHFLNRGLGGALGTGFEYAKSQGYSIVITFDADGQHQATDIPKMIKPIFENVADVVIGSRFLGNEPLPLIRRLVIQLSNVLTWLLFGVWTSDSQSGLRAFSNRVIQRIEIKSERMEVSSEIFSQIKKNNWRVTEVPILPIYTEYSLYKGQKISNAPRVFWKLIMQKLS